MSGPTPPRCLSLTSAAPGGLRPCPRQGPWYRAPVTTPTLDLGSQVYEIDTLMSGHTGITAGYAILGDHPCLIETGTAKSAPVVRDALAALGVGPQDLRTIVVT